LAVSSPSPKPVILLFGYWPPTGTDWMLSDYKNGKDVGNYRIEAYSPTFGQPLGWQNGSPPNQLVPWWGPGSGHPLVDFRDTANFFWTTLDVRSKNPIAIMSFSRSPGFDVKWILEPNAYNYANADWWTDLHALFGTKYYPSPTPTYPPPLGSGSLGGTPTNVPALSAPYIGGGTGDPSPRKHDTPQTGNPPDPSKAAGASRASNLPTTEIVNAINAAVNDTSKVDPTTSGSADTLQKYVSAYMAYLVNWYGGDTVVQPANPAIRKYGHTHVGIKTAPADAKTALNAQVNALVAWLDSH